MVYKVYNMELEIDFSGISKQFSDVEIKKKIKRCVATIANECELSAKETISSGAVDSGRFLNSVFTETWEKDDEMGFTMYDGVDYGIYHEYGTIRHWLPFFYYGDTSKPVLADWGRRVLGLSDEEMLKQGGMMVELDELMPFRKALLEIENKVQDIFNMEFNK